VSAQVQEVAEEGGDGISLYRGLDRVRWGAGLAGRGPESVIETGVVTVTIQKMKGTRP
jgi:hypothetical protein